MIEILDYKELVCPECKKQNWKLRYDVDCEVGSHDAVIFCETEHCNAWYNLDDNLCMAFDRPGNLLEINHLNELEEIKYPANPSV